MAAITAVSPKPAKLLPRLGPNYDGELLATVAAIRRTHEAAGLDLHDLAAHVGSALYKPADHQPKADTGWKPWNTGSARHGPTAADFHNAARRFAEQEARKARASKPTAPFGVYWWAVCDTILADCTLNEKERAFVVQMRESTPLFHPSEKQAAWLTSLYRRVRH